MESILLRAETPTTEMTSPVATAVSFAPYIDFLKKQVPLCNSMRAKFYRFVIRKFKQHPALLQPFNDLKILEEHQDLLQLVDATIFPLANAEETLFALTMPMTLEMFYFSKGMFNAIADKDTGFIKEMRSDFSKENFRARKETFLYYFILREFYGIDFDVDTSVVHPLWDVETNLMKYYNARIDTRFVKLIYKGELPEIDHRELTQLRQGIFDLDKMHQLVPIDQFSLEGFAIVNLEEITAQESIHQIRNTVLGINELTENEVFDYIKGSLKTLLQQNDLEIGLLPFLKVNDQFVRDDEAGGNSILLKVGCDRAAQCNSYTQIAQKYQKNPKPFVAASITTELVEQMPMLGMLYKEAIRSYLLLPLFNNGKVLGVLELASRTPGLISNQFISKIEPAKHLLSQVLQHSIDVFNSRIERTIREKFTSLQPSVEWKFSEVSWDYLQKLNADSKADIGNVVFENVFPLYGAIDIRDSSVERNAAIQKDYQHQFEVLEHTLQQLKDHTEISLLDEMIFKCVKWRSAIRDVLNAEDELKIGDFFENDVNPLLQHFQENNEDLSDIIGQYFRQSELFKGVMHNNRDEYQQSVDLINNRLIQFMEKERETLQKSYPNYFEKYRTDGIEYNIYIGQSIAPHKPFDVLYLKNLRLWQLSSMAAITRLTEKLLGEMKVKLHTTQLILIHNNAIDISFRRDERRFDVEGAYNIRYEIMKKRIDKVHVFGTGERLTQPGKIALVYSNKKEAMEYIKFIEYLQEKKVLLDGLERLELEEVQGLYGLKALRVGVVL